LLFYNKRHIISGDSKFLLPSLVLLIPDFLALLSIPLNEYFQLEFFTCLESFYLLQDFVNFTYYLVVLVNLLLLGCTH